MRKTALILGIIGVVSISCTTMGPKAVFTDDRALGDLTVPVEYTGGLPSVDPSTAGVLRINAATTRFVSERGTTHLNLPTSSIRDVYVKSEAKLNAWKTALRFMFMSVFALLLKDKTEFLSLEFEEPGKSTGTHADFKIKVGSGQALKGAIIEKRDMAVAALTPGEKPAAAKPEYERAFDRAMAIDTIPAWEEFVRTQTNPEFREKARLRLKELLAESDWSTTKAADTAAKYEEFLVRNPDSKHAEEARANLSRIKEGRPQKAEVELAADLEKTGQKMELANAKSLPSPKDTFTIDQELRGSILTGKVDEVARLVKAGADVNLKFDFGATSGMTPLLLLCVVSFAESPDRAEIARILIRAGADVHFKYKDSMSLLGMAVQNAGNVALIEPLVQNGLDINAGNQLGQTPMHGAAFHGKTDWIEALLKNGAKLEPRDQKGQTPLHVGVIQKQTKAVALLLAKGADVNARTSYGATPLDLAAYPELNELIRKNGGISGKK